MNKTSRNVQDYFQELQENGRIRLWQSEAEGYDWDGMMEHLETQFAKGDEQVHLRFTSAQQKEIVVKYLRSIGFEVYDEYSRSPRHTCFVKVKPPLYQKLIEDWGIFLAVLGCLFAVFGWVVGTALSHSWFVVMFVGMAMVIIGSIGELLTQK